MDAPDGNRKAARSPKRRAAFEMVSGSIRVEGWRSAVEEVEDQLGWSGDDGPPAPDADGALHQRRVFQQEVDYSPAVEQSCRVHVQLLEGCVPSDQVRRRAVQEAKYRFQGRPVQWVLQVLDGVELDAALLENAEGAPGLSSARVVVEEESVGHGRDGSTWPVSGTATGLG